MTGDKETGSSSETCFGFSVRHGVPYLRGDSRCPQSQNFGGPLRGHGQSWTRSVLEVSTHHNWLHFSETGITLLVAMLNFRARGFFARASYSRSAAAFVLAVHLFLTFPWYGFFPRSGHRNPSVRTMPRRASVQRRMSRLAIPIRWMCVGYRLRNCKRRPFVIEMQLDETDVALCRFVPQGVSEE